MFQDGITSRFLPAWRWWQAGLTAVSLAVTVRLVQLTGGPSTVGDTTPPNAVGQRDRAAAQADRELAQLYAHCPMAAVADFATVAASPETAESLLPAYTSPAEHLPAPADDAPIPRVRYPHPVPTQVAHRGPHDGILRVAARPGVRLPMGRLASTTPGKTTSPNGQWLIDPNEWFTPEERAKRGDTEAARETPAETATPAETPSPKPERSPPAVEPNTPTAAPAQTPPAPATQPATPSPAPATMFAPPAAPSATTPPAAAPIQHPAPSALPFPPPAAPAAAPANVAIDGVDPHLALYARNAYPSARECAQCHEDIYNDWRISAHAYAAVSPMFHKFEQKLNDVSQGTVGYFCVRCHAPVATNMNASRAEPIWNLPEVAREGVTCVACHRVKYVYGKSNGERRIEEGDIFAPVYGGLGGDGVEETIHRKDHFKVKTSPQEEGPGQPMHVEGIYFEPLTRSEFCTPCHQVAVHPGIKLEVVWEQYRASPACKKGISCQDCHMGRVPGLPLGYEVGPVAKVGDKTINDQRKRSNHVFFGPNYSIAHPGLFPFHLKASRWTMQEWLAFDWRAGWGLDEFEDRLAESGQQVEFPACWAEADDRRDAREIIDENIKALSRKRQLRIEVMENGSHVEGPFFDSPPRCGQDVDFHVVVTNTNEGHNLLTASLGAQPQLWANVALIGPDGRRLWESGYTDSFGDLANIHSVDVRHGRLPFDWQLFNLQTMFLITGAKGTDREFYVPVNVDIDQLPFIRPGAQPIGVINHPPFIRMESQSLAPLGSRRVPYRVPGEFVRQPGTYRLSFRMRSRAEPMYLMRFCDATIDMQRSMNEWMIDLHEKSVEFYVR
jgi:hypothetical protein